MVGAYGGCSTHRGGSESRELAAEVGVQRPALSDPSPPSEASHPRDSMTSPNSASFRGPSVEIHEHGGDISDRNPSSGAAPFFALDWEALGRILTSSLAVLAEQWAHQELCRSEAIKCMVITGHGRDQQGCRCYLSFVSPAGPCLQFWTRNNPFKLQQDLFHRLAGP